MNKKFAIILQAGKETHEGTARALHALLYASELKEKGNDVVLIFDGAGTQWYEEFTNSESKSKLMPAYRDFRKTGVMEVVCDYCAGAFEVKDVLTARTCQLTAEYNGHPSIERWIAQGYELIVI